MILAPFFTADASQALNWLLIWTILLPISRLVILSLSSLETEWAIVSVHTTALAERNVLARAAVWVPTLTVWFLAVVPSHAFLQLLHGVLCRVIHWLPW
jgi:hypothetical protein